MARLGIITSSATGHLNPSMALGKGLKAKGHDVYFYQLCDTEEKVRAAGFHFRGYGLKRFPKGRMPAHYRELGELKGRQALSFTIALMGERMKTALDEIPALVEGDRLDGLIVDQFNLEGGTIAEGLKIPFVSLSNALIFNQEPDIPPFFTTWPYRPSILAATRNRLANHLLNRSLRPNLEVINGHRRKHGLKTAGGFSELDSKLALISQQPPEFEYPRRRLAPNTHFVGPLFDPAARAPVDFPHHRLDGRPIVFASMGTLQNRQGEIFGGIARACSGLPVQLVISLGGGSSPADLPALEGDPIVVSYAPQLELLKKTSLCITHAGLNTVLEALSEGVPMVAIPIANDQPAVAARLAWIGAGVIVRPAEMSPEKLRASVEEVLRNPRYRSNAARFRELLSGRSGIQEAVRVIESVLPGCRDSLSS